MHGAVSGTTPARTTCTPRCSRSQQRTGPAPPRCARTRVWVRPPRTAQCRPGVMSTAIAFHDAFDIRDWQLYANPTIYTGRGLAHAEGRIYAQDGRFVASYVCEVMIRPRCSDRSQPATLTAP